MSACRAVPHERVSGMASKGQVDPRVDNRVGLSAIHGLGRPRHPCLRLRAVLYAMMTWTPFSSRNRFSLSGMPASVIR
jgi:hypothetical protein